MADETRKDHPAAGDDAPTPGAPRGADTPREGGPRDHAPHDAIDRAAAEETQEGGPGVHDPEGAAFPNPGGGAVLAPGGAKRGDPATDHPDEGRGAGDELRGAARARAPGYRPPAARCGRSRRLRAPDGGSRVPYDLRGAGVRPRRRGARRRLRVPRARPWRHRGADHLRGRRSHRQRGRARRHHGRWSRRAGAARDGGRGGTQRLGCCGSWGSPRSSRALSP